MKNVITNRQKRRARVSRGSADRRARSRDFKSLSAGAAWHTRMLLLLLFVFQVPTPPVGVTGSFEVLAFTPVATINFAFKGNKLLLLLGVCEEGLPGRGQGTGMVCLGSLGMWGCQGPVPLAWWEMWFPLCSTDTWFSRHASPSLLHSLRSHRPLFQIFV